MKARYALGAALAAMVGITSSSSASAQGAHGFGDRTQLIVSADRLFPFFSYSSLALTTEQNGTTEEQSVNGSSVSLLFGRETSGPQAINPHTVPRLAFDVALGHFTVGGAVVLAFGLGGTDETETRSGATTTTIKSDTPTSTVFGFAPRVGYIVPLGEMIALWPRGGFSFYSVSTKSETTNGAGATTENTQTGTQLSLDLDPQFVLVPFEHFFLSAGPLLNIPLTGSQTSENVSGNVTQSVDRDLSLFHIGISAGLGGYFDL